MTDYLGIDRHIVCKIVLKIRLIPGTILKNTCAKFAFYEVFSPNWFDIGLTNSNPNYINRL